MTSSLVSEHIFPPLATMVEGYANTKYHLLEFNANQFDGKMHTVATVEAQFELDAITKILQDRPAFDRVISSRMPFFWHVPQEPQYQSFSAKSDYLNDFYIHNPQMFLDDINDTWEGGQAQAYTLVSESNPLYTVLKTIGSIDSNMEKEEDE